MPGHKFTSFATTAFALMALSLMSSIANPQLFATTLCVNPGGTAGCFSKIKAAVSAASPNDTIKVAPGTYKEDVIIGKSLSLIGAKSVVLPLSMRPT
jgi:pectin methylesterase-like acyl-CoA thioesterase